MKKISQAVVLLIVVAAMSLGFAACGETPTEKEELNFDAVYAMAADLGFSGDLDDLIEAFKGDSAYEVAVSLGYGGTESEWLLTLVGAKGSDGQTPHIGANGNWWIGERDTTVKARGERGDGGKSAYEIWMENGGCGENCDCTETEFLEWLKGGQGEAGQSAYEIFKEHYPGYTGGEKQWITDLAAGRLLRTVTFKAANTQDIVLTVLYGASLTDIPAVPSKPGNEGAWDVTDFANITENITVNAVYTTQGLQYQLNQSGTAYIVDGAAIGEATAEVFIPFGHGGVPVAEIKAKAFQNKTALQKISIPASVKVVGEDAFDNTGIMNDSPANEAVYAGNWAVGYKEQTAVMAAYRRAASTDEGNITLREGTVGVANKAFYGKTALTGVTMPDSIRTVGARSFEKCTALKYVVLSKNLARLENYSFFACTQLESIVIPASVENIYESVFANCTRLADVTFAPDAKLRNIGWNAFAKCVALREIAIPSSVMIMGDGAFAGCTALAGIEFAADNLQIFGGNVFNNTAWLNAQPDGPVYLGRILYTYKGTMPANTELVIPAGTRAVAGSALEKQINLKKITIPASVVSIWTKALNGCTTLDEIALEPGSRLQNVAREVFKATAWLEAQPDGLVYIGKVLYMYKGTMPVNTVIAAAEGTTGIAGGAFSGQSNLAAIDLPSSVAYIGDHAFDGCTALASISIPGKVWSMGDRSFLNCSSLTSIVIPASVQDIGATAFVGCDQLTIYAGYASLPSGWDGSWNMSKRPVVWNCELSDGGRLLSVVKTADGIANAANGITAPQCAGFEFGGWAISAENALGNISAYAAGEIANAPDGITLWAIWTAI